MRTQLSASVRKQSCRRKKTLSEQEGRLSLIMRPLTEEETKTLFLKLSEYIGKNVEKLINRSDERHCFRLLKDRCYYISESLVKASSVISRDNLLHAGTCLGKFTKSGKFRLHITALDYLSQYAKVRINLQLEKWHSNMGHFTINMVSFQ